MIVPLAGAPMMVLTTAPVEVGHVYYAYQKLAASTNAAVLAEAQSKPDTTQATSKVILFSAQSGQPNASPAPQNVVATTTFFCLDTVSNCLDVLRQTQSGTIGSYLFTLRANRLMTGQLPAYCAPLACFGIQPPPTTGEIR